MQLMENKGDKVGQPLAHYLCLSHLSLNTPPPILPQPHWALSCHYPKAQHILPLLKAFVLCL